MSSIFISYRRDDTAPYAGRLYDRLVSEFGQAAVFMDIDAVGPGDDFVEVIDRRLASCGAVVAVIGQNWLTARDRFGNRRLDSPDDIVRGELRRALQHGIRVMPVLVAGASMPQAQDLPNDIASLARRNAVTLTDSRFHHEATVLIAALQRTLLVHAQRVEAGELRALRTRLLACLTFRIAQLSVDGPDGSATLPGEAPVAPRKAPAGQHGRKAAPSRRRWQAERMAGKESIGGRTLSLRLANATHVIRFENDGYNKRIKVDGKVAASVGPSHLYKFRSSVKLSIRDGRVRRPAVLEYHLGLAGNIKGFRLTVDDRIVYQEGTLA